MAHNINSNTPVIVQQNPLFNSEELQNYNIARGRSISPPPQRAGIVSLSSSSSVSGKRSVTPGPQRRIPSEIQRSISPGQQRTVSPPPLRSDILRSVSPPPQRTNKAEEEHKTTSDKEQPNNTRRRSHTLPNLVQELKNEATRVAKSGFDGSPPNSFSNYDDIRVGKKEFSPPTSPQPHRIKQNPSTKLSIELRTLLDALNTSIQGSEKDINCLFRVDDSFSKLLHQFVEKHCDKWLNGIILRSNVEDTLRAFLKLVRLKPAILATSPNKEEREAAEKEIKPFAEQLASIINDNISYSITDSKRHKMSQELIQIFHEIYIQTREKFKTDKDETITRVALSVLYLRILAPPLRQSLKLPGKVRERAKIIQISLQILELTNPKFSQALLGLYQA